MHKRRLMLIATVALVAAVSACGGGGNGGGGNGGGGDVHASGEAGVSALLNADLAARRAQDLDARYSLESPSYRAACRLIDFKAEAGNDWYGAPPALRAAGATYADIGARDVKITINGDTAGIVFILTANGRDLFRVGDPNPYRAVYEQGQWWRYDLVQDPMLGQHC